MSSKIESEILLVKELNPDLKSYHGLFLVTLMINFLFNTEPTKMEWMTYASSSIVKMSTHHIYLQHRQKQNFFVLIILN